MNRYSFEVQQITRPTPPSRSEHSQVIEAALATAGTEKSVVITPEKGETAANVLQRVRTAINTRAKRLGRAVAVRAAIQSNKVVVWCEHKGARPSMSVPSLPAAPVSPTPSAKAPVPLASHTFDPTEARVVKALELDESGGLLLPELARAVYGRSDAERKSTGLLVVLNNLCKRGILVQAPDKRYELGKGVRSGLA